MHTRATPVRRLDARRRCSCRFPEADPHAFSGREQRHPRSTPWFARATARDPAARFASARDAAAELRRVCQARGVAAEDKEAAAVPAEGVRTKLVSPPPEAARSKVGLYAGLGIAAVAAVGVTVFVLGRSPASPPPATLGHRRLPQSRRRRRPRPRRRPPRRRRLPRPCPEPAVAPAPAPVAEQAATPPQPDTAKPPRPVRPHRRPDKAAATPAPRPAPPPAPAAAPPKPVPARPGPPPAEKPKVNLGI